MQFEEESQTHNWDIYNINEVITQTQKCLSFHNCTNKLFSEENNVPASLFEATEVAGSTKHKQSKTV